MGRIARVVPAGRPHDVTQRGNFRRDNFLDDHDRKTYLELAVASAFEAQLRVWNHGLVSNGIHLIIAGLTGFFDQDLPYRPQQLLPLAGRLCVRAAPGSEDSRPTDVEEGPSHLGEPSGAGDAGVGCRLRNGGDHEGDRRSRLAGRVRGWR